MTTLSSALVEFGTDDGLVLIRVTVPSGAGFELELTGDEARAMSNHLGEAILDTTRSDDMTDWAAWTAEDPAPEPEVVEQSEPVAASWLPASVQRAQYLEDVAEAREARAAERARAEQAEQAHDAAVAAHLAAAAARGEPVAPIDAATGNVGRPLMDVLEAARGDLTRDYAPQAPADERFYGGEMHPATAKRSAWTSPSRSLGHDSETPSEYERDSLDEHLVRRYQELHWALVQFRGKRDGAGAMEAARARSEASRSARATRPSAPRRDDGDGPEITRTVPMIGW